MVSIQEKITHEIRMKAPTARNPSQLSHDNYVVVHLQVNKNQSSMSLFAFVGNCNVLYNFFNSFCVLSYFAQQSYVYT